MIWNYNIRIITVPAILAFSALIPLAQSQHLPNTGQQLTPLAVNGAGFQPLNPGLPDNPGWLAGQAVTAVVSPDHKMLLVLTSGYNLVNYSSGPDAGKQNDNESSEYVFVYDITHLKPEQTQVIHVPNTYGGIVFHPDGKEFYVSGGVDDNVVQTRSQNQFTPWCSSLWACLFSTTLIWSR